MKRSVLIVVTLMLCMFVSNALASPSYCQNETAAKEDLKQSLLKTYGNSFSTVKMLLDAGMRDYGKICALPNDQVRQGILSDLNNTYYPSFSTIFMLYEANYKDYQALQ